MKTNVRTIVQASIALIAIRNVNDLPIKTAWQIDDLIEAFSKHVQRFDKERFEIVKKYGTQNKENPDLWDIPNYVDFQKEVDVLGAIEVEIEVKKLPKAVFDADDIKAPKGVSLKDLRAFIE